MAGILWGNSSNTCRAKQKSANKEKVLHFNRMGMREKGWGRDLIQKILRL
jgi:hypothetical protein